MSAGVIHVAGVPYVECIALRPAKPRTSLRLISVTTIVFTFVVAAGAQTSAPAVGTVVVNRSAISQTAGFVGRVEAIDSVQIQARVQGYLEAVLFKEGDFVKKNTPLYQIEKGPFQAAVDAAKAALVRSDAAKTLTEVQLARATQLLAQNTGTAVARDQAQADGRTARGTIMSDQANLDTATINLGYTDIISPISGKISKTNVTVGNVVGPNSGPLTQVVSQDPMYLSFPVSERDLLQARLNNRDMAVKDIKVRIRFADGSIYDQEGVINFIDVSVNQATDTVLARATVANPNGALIDGQLVTVSLESGRSEEKVLVPQAALIADQQGVYVFVVQDGNAVIRRVKTSGENGPNAIVDDGLSGGEQLIVEGIQNVRPNQPVKASPMSLGTGAG